MSNANMPTSYEKLLKDMKKKESEFLRENPGLKSIFDAPMTPRFHSAQDIANGHKG